MFSRTWAQMLTVSARIRGRCAGPHPNLGSTQVSKLLKLNERRQLQHPSTSLAPPLAPGGQGCVKMWACLQIAGAGHWHVACLSPVLLSRTRNAACSGQRPGQHGWLLEAVSGPCRLLPGLLQQPPHWPAAPRTMPREWNTPARARRGAQAHDRDLRVFM